MKYSGLSLRMLLAGAISGLLLLVGLTGAKPAGASAGFPLPYAATDEPAAASSGASNATTPGQAAIIPLSELWAGDPSNPNYDGRLAATMADRYAVYCKDGELQVWDGRENRKIAALLLTRVGLMLSNSSVAAGGGVFIGRSNNVLTVVGPGDFVKDGLDFAACIGGIR